MDRKPESAKELDGSPASGDSASLLDDAASTRDAAGEVGGVAEVELQTGPSDSQQIVWKHPLVIYFVLPLIAGVLLLTVRTVSTSIQLRSQIGAEDRRQAEMTASQVIVDQIGMYRDIEPWIERYRSTLAHHVNTDVLWGDSARVKAALDTLLVLRLSQSSAVGSAIRRAFGGDAQRLYAAIRPASNELHNCLNRLYVRTLNYPEEGPDVPERVGMREPCRTAFINTMESIGAFEIAVRSVMSEHP